jgi:hypothetical protein
MNFSFYGYTVRATTEADLALATEWCGIKPIGGNSALAERIRTSPGRFWIDSKDEPRRQNFLVSKDGEPIAFFQRERVNATQVRLHFQASPVASRKKILRGITMLVPLIENGLASGGVKHIFFTSHSLAMIAFMEKRMGYWLARNTDGGVDGAVMFKQLDAVKVEFHVTALPATLPPHCGSVLRVVADAPSSAGAAPQEPKSGVAEQTAERGAK